MGIIEEIRYKREYGYSDEQIAELIGIEVEDVRKIGKMADWEGKQRKGIEEAKARGVKFGREIQYGKDEEEENRVMMDYDRKYITWQEGARKLGMSKKSTFFYRYYRWVSSHKSTHASTQCK